MSGATLTFISKSHRRHPKNALDPESCGNDHSSPMTAPLVRPAGSRRIIRTETTWTVMHRST